MHANSAYCVVHASGPDDVVHAIGLCCVEWLTQHSGSQPYVVGTGAKAVTCDSVLRLVALKINLIRLFRASIEITGATSSNASEAAC